MKKYNKIYLLETQVRVSGPGVDDQSSSGTSRLSLEHLMY
jgi:hypothetical protein